VCVGYILWRRDALYNFNSLNFNSACSVLAPGSPVNRKFVKRYVQHLQDEGHLGSQGLYWRL